MKTSCWWIWVLSKLVWVVNFDLKFTYVTTTGIPELQMKRRHFFCHAWKVQQGFKVGFTKAKLIEQKFTFCLVPDKKINLVKGTLNPTFSPEQVNRIIYEETPSNEGSGICVFWAAETSSLPYRRKMASFKIYRHTLKGTWPPLFLYQISVKTSLNCRVIVGLNCVPVSLSYERIKMSIKVINKPAILGWERFITSSAGMFHCIRHPNVLGQQWHDCSSVDKAASLEKWDTVPAPLLDPSPIHPSDFAFSQTEESNFRQLRKLKHLLNRGAPEACYRAVLLLDLGNQNNHEQNFRHLWSFSDLLLGIHLSLWEKKLFSLSGGQKGERVKTVAQT